MPGQGDRIVVNLEQPAGQEFKPVPQMGIGGPVPPPVINSKPKRRGGCILKGLVALFVLGLIVVGIIGIAGYFYWESYKTKPAYSLALLIDAAARDDQAAIDELFDTNKVVDDYIAQVKEQARKSPLTVGPLKQIIEQAITRMTPQIKERAREEVKNRVKELGQRAEGKPFIVYALALPFVMDIKEDGDKATATINRGVDTIELKMERNGDKWKIVGVKDNEAIVRIAEKVIKDATNGGGGRGK
jgi:hypothetical protein